MSAVCACGQRVTVDKPVLYADIARGWWIQIAVADRRPAFATCEGEARAEFAGVFDPMKFPKAVAAIGERLRVRVVFGHEELREKVVCADHELDDRLVEILKLEVLVARPDLLEAGIEILVLDAVIDGGLVLIGLAPDDRGRFAAAGEIRVRRSAHDSLAARRDELAVTYPALFDGCYVNALRYRATG
jgi:CpXC motif protein